MTKSKKQKTLIVGVSAIILVALIGVLITLKMNEIPQELLIVSDKDYALAENVQTTEKISKKHVILNRPEIDNEHIKSIYDTISKQMIDASEFKKSLIVDWNASTVFDQYLNFEVTMTLDQETIEKETFVLNIEALDKLDVSTLFLPKTIDEYSIENNGELFFNETEVTVADKTITEEKLPDAIKKDYGKIKPTPPPVINKPKPTPKPNPNPANGKKYVAFTFDDGPSKDYTTRIMNTADQYNAKVTFFTLGSQVEKFPEIAKSIVDRGHQLASHSYNHPDLTKLSKDEQLYQINTTENILRNATGYTKDIIVRPPYGANNETLLSNVPKIYMNWSNDTRDWESRNAQSICNNIINDTKPGDVILLHDIYESTADGFACGIKSLAEQGYKFVTVDQLFQEYGTATSNGHIYRRP